MSNFVVNPYIVTPAGLSLLYEQANYPTYTHSMRDFYATTRFQGSNVESGGAADGLSIKQVVAYFKQNGDCSGLDLVAQVRNYSSGCTVKKELGLVDAGAISTSYEEVTFPEQDEGYTLIAGDVIGYYLDGGSSTNKISLGGSFPHTGNGTNYGESNSCTYETATNVQQPTIQIWG